MIPISHDAGVSRVLLCSEFDVGLFKMRSMEQLVRMGKTKIFRLGLGLNDLSLFIAGLYQ